jgi:hypothetical protein
MKAESKQTPLLAGWAIAAGVGLVATGVSYVAIGLGALQACFIGSVLLVVVGLILGLPGREQGAPAVPGGSAGQEPGKRGDG